MVIAVPTAGQRFQQRRALPQNFFVVGTNAGDGRPSYCGQIIQVTPAFGRIQCALIERPAGVRLEDIHDLLCGFIGLQDGMHMISPHMRS